MLSNDAKRLRLKLSELIPLLNERQRRILAAAEAKALGRGGVSTIAEITGISRQTIYDGMKELGDHSAPDRVRKTGGGRKKLTDIEPDIIRVLDEIVSLRRTRLFYCYLNENSRARVGLP